METICILVLFMFLMFSKLNSHLIIENLALRQQLTVLKQSMKRPKIRPRDRIFWVFLSCVWKDWQDVLIVVKPETVIRWHKRDSSCSGVTNPEKEGQGDHQLILKFERSLRIWQRKICFGVLPECMVN